MRNSFQLNRVVDCRRVGPRQFALMTCAIVVSLLSRASAPAQDDIGPLTEQARGSFKAVDDGQLKAAREELTARMQDLEQFVGPTSQNGQRWMRYLKWDALKKELGVDQPKDFAAFDDTLQQLNRNQSGLENKRFRNVAKALQHYRDTLAVSKWDKPAEIYGRQLDALQKDMEAFRKQPSPATQAALSQRIYIIDSIGQAPKLVSALRDELARPNALVDVSTSLLSAATGAINRRKSVVDCIVGSTVYSDTHSTGYTTVVTIPSEDKAVLEISSVGHTLSKSVGYNGPAIIHSTTDSDFTSSKRVELSDRAFVASPTQAEAVSDTHYHSISKKDGGIGGKLISRMGWKKARENECEVERVAAGLAKGRVEEHTDHDVDEALRKARKRYDEDFRAPLERRGEFPEHIQFSSRKNGLGIEVTQASRKQLGATTNPPELAQQHDVNMRLHESAVNNYSASILGGATARQDKPDEQVKFNVDMPKWLKKLWENRKTEKTESAEPFKKYALTLRDGRPISVNFAKDKVTLTVHIAELVSGDKTYTDWDVTSNYIPKVADGRVTLERDGDLVMLPYNFKGQLTSRQVAERRNLEEELNKRSEQGRGFPKTIKFEPTKPEGKMANAGPLEYRTFSSDNGWLVVGMDRQTKAAPKQPTADRRKTEVHAETQSSLSLVNTNLH